MKVETHYKISQFVWYGAFTLFIAATTVMVALHWGLI